MKDISCLKQNFCDLTKFILSQAKKLGASAAEVTINADDGFSINVRKNSVENIEYSKEKKLCITVYFGYRSGFATTSDLSPPAIAKTVEKACYIAKFTNEDPFSGLADKELLAFDYPDLDLYHPWKIEVSDAIDLAKNCENTALSYNKLINNSEGTSVNSHTNFSFYGNSLDFYGDVASTAHSINCTLVAESNNEMQRDHYYTVNRDPVFLENTDDIATKAASQTIKRLGAKRISTMECPIIFSAQLASELIGSFVGAIYGTNLYRKTSFLVDHLGKQIFPKQIQIEENPLLHKAIGSTPFDNEGVKLNRSDVVVDGVLKRYLLDNYSARKLKMKSTGNAGGVHNLILKPGDLSLNNLIKKMGSGLLITEMLGSGVNIVTGDYSRGIFGYLIENSEIQYPVTGATIAGNLKDIFMNIEDIGNDVDYRHNILTGSILINKMTVAGNQL